jgi:hypothetical protein
MKEANMNHIHTMDSLVIEEIRRAREKNPPNDLLVAAVYEVVGRCGNRKITTDKIRKHLSVVVARTMKQQKIPNLNPGFK